MALFTFEQRPYWRPHYADGIDNLLNKIPHCFETINKFIKNPTNTEFVKGFLRIYYYIYITEISSGENTGIWTLKGIENALRGQSSSERVARKIKNLSNAVNYMFGEIFSIGTLKHEFNVDLAKNLNKLIGKGLFTNAGSYRRNNAKPSGYNFLYLEATLIEDHMNELFRDINMETSQDMCAWFEIAAKFFIRFLYIHPFSNGNGRTARILLSALLIKCTFVPLSLFSSSFKNNSNAEYLHCLEEAHVYGNDHLLTSLVIESTHRLLQMFLNILDIETENM